MPTAYLGITIGPVYETLNTAETPASLWCGSYLFSMLARKICETLAQRNCTILAPTHEYGSIQPNDGIGRYYDRIIARYEVDALTKEDIETVLQDARKEIGTQVIAAIPNNAPSIEALCEYLYTYYICVLPSDEMENVLKLMDPYLDVLELYQSGSPRQKENPFIRLFQGRKDGQNAFIAQTSFLTNNLACALLKPTVNGDDESNAVDGGRRSIRPLEDIASCGLRISETTLKYQKYFALVSADGDFLGSASRALPNEKIAAFQHQCREYINAAADVVTQYGGVVVYGGGDDLLFLAPLVGKPHESNQRRQSLFDCLSDIRLCFEIAFDETIQQERAAERPIPTISFGVSIQHYKHPLAEALGDARALLDGVKRGEAIRGKNSVAIKLEKSSGMVIRLFLRNESRVDEQLRLALGDILGGTMGDDQWLNSLIHHTAEHDRIIGIAAETGIPMRPVFANIYDAEAHLTDDGNPIPAISSALDMLEIGMSERAQGNVVAAGCPDERSADGYLLENLLRFLKFFREGVGDE